MNRKGQIGLQEILAMIFVGVLLVFLLPIFIKISSGQFDLDAFVNAFIPLFILAIIFEFLRRLFS